MAKVEPPTIAQPGMASDMRWLSTLRCATLLLVKRWLDFQETGTQNSRLIAEDQAREILARCIDLEWEMSNKYGCDYRMILPLMEMSHGEEVVKRLFRADGSC